MSYKYKTAIEKIEKFEKSCFFQNEISFARILKSNFGFPLESNRDELDKIAEVIASAGSINEVADYIIKENFFLYHVASKANLDGKHWFRVRALLGDKCQKADSDAGALLISSIDGAFSVCIPNGYGDGTMRYAFFDAEDEESESVQKMMNYVIEAKGSFNVFDYDCHIPGKDTPVAVISGNYNVYNYEGMVAFVKQS